MKTLHTLALLFPVVDHTHSLPMHPISNRPNLHPSTSPSGFSILESSQGKAQARNTSPTPHQSRIILPAKQIARNRYDISELFTTTGPPRVKHAVTKVIADPVKKVQSDTIKDHEAKDRQKRKSVGHEGTSKLNAKRPSKDASMPVTDRPSTSTSNNAFEEFQSLQRVANTDGTTRPLPYEEFKNVLGMHRARLRYQKQNSLRSSKVQLVSLYDELNDRLPLLSGRSEWPNEKKYQAMSQDVKQKWIHGLQVAHAEIQENQKPKPKWHLQVWPADKKRSEFQKFTEEQIKNMDPHQREVWDQHLKNFDENEELGLPHSVPRSSYMISHMGLRLVGLPLPEPAGGKDRLTLEKFSAKTARKAKEQRIGRTKVKSTLTVDSVAN